MEQLKREMAKPKPKSDVVKELVKRTLKSRREIVLDGVRPEIIMEKYPHLKKSNYVSFNYISGVLIIIYYITDIA